VKVDPALFAKYSWSARAIKYHRAQIRDSFGFREATRRMSNCWRRGWPGRCAGLSWSRTAWSRRCWRTVGRSGSSHRPGERIVASASAQFDAWLCSRTVDRLGSAQANLARLVEGQDDAHGPGAGLLAQLKADPDAVSLDAILTEIRKLQAVRTLGLPADLFADVSEKLVAAWRARAVKMYPSDFRDTRRRCGGRCWRRCAGRARWRSPMRWSSC